MTNEQRRPTILCLASYEKGHDFMRECHRQGWRVLLLTSLSLREEAAWPRAEIDDIYYMPDVRKEWDEREMIRAVSHLARAEEFDLIVPLDDFDLEKAAALREHLRVPGMGETTTRHFRDKLAMRLRAREAGIRVPEFVHALNRARLEDYAARVPPPWLLKPRLEASAAGIKKINSADELWPALDALGDRQSFHLLERYVPGDIFHVDSVVSEREIVFTSVSRYGHPPLDVAHGGGVFTTRTLPRGADDERALAEQNRRVLEAMGMVRGVSHTEFIKSRADGEFYFLETAARVGGAHIVELVEAARGINLWAEWAKIETGRGSRPYELPPLYEDNAGLIVSLARQQRPDTSAYDDPEIVWRLSKPSHVGLIVRSPDPARVEQLLDAYARRFAHDFLATLPAADKPAS
jgi:biotin carboxylase